MLLQMLLLSESDSHLGKVSKHMTQVSTVPAQGQRGEQLSPIHPADSQGFFLPASQLHSCINRTETERKNLTGKEKTNKQMKRVVGVTYRVLLASPSCHASPEAL